MNAPLFQDRVVLLTGAAGGLGEAYARAFAREGAKIALVDAGTDLDGSGQNDERVLSLAQRLESEGAEVIALPCDMRDEPNAEKAVTRAVEALGPLDVLVTSTGALADRSLLTLQRAEWDLVNDACLRATFVATQAFARHVVSKGRAARIVHTVGLQGITGSLSQANLAAAQSGIYGFMRSCSIELQRHKITVNAVAPLAKTRMTEHLPMFHDVDSLTPEHVAPAVLYLASDLIGTRTGYLLAAAGARIFSYKFVETSGVYKEEGAGIWTPEEIRDHWDAITKGG